MKFCKECDLTFESNSQYANHIRWKHREHYSENGRKKLSENARRVNEKRRTKGNYIEEDANCLKCGTAFVFKHREFDNRKPFCSLSCANSRILTLEQKKKHSDGVKRAWKNQDYRDKLAKSLILKKQFSSKRERQIVNHFKEKFPQYAWKSGGNIKHDNVFISRDLWSDVLKVCIEYDGIWHFKNIHDQLEKKKAKDLALKEWCEKHDYRLIRISEKFLENRANEYLEDLVFRNDERYVELYTDLEKFI